VSEDDYSGPAVEAIALVKRFAVKGWLGRSRSTVEALRGATMTVAAGSIHGVMGPNGSGKSTLLRILATLVIADGGEATVDGYHVDLEERQVKQAIGFSTGEERSMYWRLTARQNLEFAAALHRLPQPAATIQHALEAVGLDHAADRPVSGFSQGMSRRLSLARALLHGPRVLLLDEPTRSLDPAARHEFQEVLRALQQERGVTTLLTTHDLGEAASICERVSMLHAGVFVEHITDVDEQTLTDALETLAT